MVMVYIWLNSDCYISNLMNSCNYKQEDIRTGLFVRSLGTLYKIFQVQSKFIVFICIFNITKY